MRRSCRAFVLLAALTAALAYARRRDVEIAARNVRTYSAPSAALYDLLTVRLFQRLFTTIADEIGVMKPSAVLEIGSGPGRLAIKLAQAAPAARVLALDVAPEMVERAANLADRAGVADRVAVRLGDAAALPVADVSIDLVVSTFSMHHWSDPDAALAEIYRVLRPGGAARIYDVAMWITRIETHGSDIRHRIADSPFAAYGSWSVRTIARLGPIPIVECAEITRA